jgi:aspartate/methionine/tyrosine aminotransferase
MRPAARRTAAIGTSVFTEITRLALEHGAVNLGQGFPDFPAPDFVKEAARRAIAADANQYAAAPGLPRLRKAIAEHLERRHGRAVDPDATITVTGGATEALFDATLALCDPGDEVVLFEPFYDAYVPNVEMAGAVPRFVRLRPPRFELDPDELRAAFGPKTKLVVVNSPHNPTGKVWPPAELDLVAALCAEHDVVALCDEVYSEITFAGARHVPLRTRPGMADRTITVDSVGKTFSVTGWKIGWAHAAPPLTTALRAVHQFVTFCSSTPLQEAAADALGWAHETGYFDELRAAYTARRDLLRGILHEAGLPTLPIAGAYFLLVDLDPIPELAGIDDVTFCRTLTTEVGVAAIPPSAFYADPRTAPRLARFCFAKRDETLRAAEAKLGGWRRAFAR